MNPFIAVMLFLIVALIAAIAFCVKSAASVIDEELNREYCKDENDGF